MDSLFVHPSTEQRFLGRYFSKIKAGQKSIQRKDWNRWTGCNWLKLYSDSYPDFPFSTHSHSLTHSLTYQMVWMKGKERKGGMAVWWMAFFLHPPSSHINFLESRWSATERHSSFSLASLPFFLSSLSLSLPPSLLVMSEDHSQLHTFLASLTINGGIGIICLILFILLRPHIKWIYAPRLIQGRKQKTKRSDYLLLSLSFFFLSHTYIILRKRYIISSIYSFTYFATSFFSLSCVLPHFSLSLPSSLLLSCVNHLSLCMCDYIILSSACSPPPPLNDDQWFSWFGSAIQVTDEQLLHTAGPDVK